MIIFSDSRDPI